MRFKKPYIASLNQVTIKREAEYAVIDYVEPEVGGVHLKIGPEVQKMTDEEILSLHNEILETQAEMAAGYEHVAVEIPLGKPQLRWFYEGGYWTPRGDVLRCEISEDEERETVIYIDDTELSIYEFGQVLSVFNGWGMRITIVPDDELDREPEIEVREPNNEWPKVH